jgi:hypothetical protein
MAAMSTPRECFVVMPYGSKPFGDGSGRLYDFEKVWRVLIARAVREAGMVPVRSDQREGSGIVHTEMFRDLRDREVVLADLSLDNPNVFYELGIRHVMNAAGTVLICRHNANLPFDVRLSRVIFYDFDGQNFDWEEVERVVKTLKLTLADAATGRPDSPVHALLESVLPRAEAAAQPVAAGAPELAPDAEPCDAYQQLCAAAWRQRGDTLDQLFDEQRTTVFGSRALAHLALTTDLPWGNDPEVDRCRRLANHLNDGQQYRLANRLYEALRRVNRLNRGSQLAYATSYSEAHDDIEGARHAITIAQQALDEAEAQLPDRDSMEGVIARAECHRRLAGLRQWYWQKSQLPADLDAAIRSFDDAVLWNDRARQIGALKHPGFLAQARLKLLVLLRIRDASAERPDHERHRDAIVALAAQPNDDVKGLSYLGWFQALALADLGQNDAALRKARTTQMDDAALRANAEHWEIGRRQYALIRRFIEQYLPYLRHHGVVGQIAQLLQGGGR